MAIRSGTRPARLGGPAYLCEVIARTVHGSARVGQQELLVATLPAQPVIDRVGRDRGGQRAEVFGGAAAMPASCSKLQCVSAD
jgi:hypothetical protein